MAEKDMSFLPEDYLERRAHRRTNLLSVVLFVIVMGGVIGAYIMSDKQRADIAKERDEINRQFADAHRKLEQLQELQRKKHQMLRKARLTGTLLERLPRSVILSQVINNMPVSMTLFDLELETKVKKTSARSRTLMDKRKNDAKSKAAPRTAEVEVKLMLIGVARTDVDVATFMAGVKASPLFDNVNLVFSEEVVIDEEKLRKFKVEAEVNHQADLAQFDPAMVKRDLKQNPWGGVITIDQNGELKAPSRKPIDNDNIVDATPRQGLGTD